MLCGQTRARGAYATAGARDQKYIVQGLFLRLHRTGGNTSFACRSGQVVYREFLGRYVRPKVLPVERPLQAVSSGSVSSVCRY